MKVIPLSEAKAKLSHYGRVCRTEPVVVKPSGLTGGKGVPATVAAHPCLFVTLTAPSFGPVHARREKNGPISKPCWRRRARRQNLLNLSRR